jgi:putative peptide zinc metalloprotease protein
MTAATTVGPASRILLHPLQTRRDADEFLVGRVEIGEFIAVPEVAVDALNLLRDGLPVDVVHDRLQELHGRDIDVAGFVTNLVDLGFVAAVDGIPVAGPDPIRPTWPWLHPPHVRWTLSRYTATAVLALPLLAVLAMAWSTDLIPTYRDLLWSPHVTLVLLGNAAIAWTIVFLHELAHLSTARAAGVPGQIRFGTRLQFLVVQTDVTGVWGAPRRVRLTVYLAGIAVDLAIAGAAILARAATGGESAAGRVFGGVALIALLPVPTQLLLFMRTDVYFVVQDLTGCRNLYADGSAYVRYLLKRSVTRRAKRPADPTAELAGNERRAVRGYAPVLAVGTALCLLFAAVITAPTAITLIARAARALIGPATAGARLDAAVGALLVGGVWLLWCRMWWRRHGPRVTAWWHRFRQSDSAGG